VDLGWWASTTWAGPPPTDGASGAEERVWRWAAGERRFRSQPDDPDDDERIEGLVDPPGWGQPGLCALDAHGRPLCALGRHPRLHPRQPRQPAWIDQAVLVPGPDAWHLAALARSQPGRTTIVDEGGTELAVHEQPGFARLQVIGKKDVLAVGGRPWKLGREVAKGGGGLQAFSLADPATGVVHARADAERKPLGDAAVPWRIGASAAPHPWELWAILVLVAAVVDAFHPVHSE
jgi:hypothetical protein